MILTLKNRFFLAILPPPSIQDYAHQLKLHFAENYQSQGALKSPPHITLQAPFEWELANLEALTTRLGAFSQTQPPIPLILNGFAAFPPRVIYIHVEKTAGLLALEKQLRAYLESHGNLLDTKTNHRPFTPHLTIAFRDLSKDNFQKAWPEFRNRSVYFQFTTWQLTLLIHDGKCWQIHTQFPFFPQPPEQSNCHECLCQLADGDQHFPPFP